MIANALIAAGCVFLLLGIWCFVSGVLDIFRSRSRRRQRREDEKADSAAHRRDEKDDSESEEDNEDRD